jgi:hypothetical protein
MCNVSHSDNQRKNSMSIPRQLMDSIPQTTRPRSNSLPASNQARLALLEPIKKNIFLTWTNMK